MAHGTYHPVMQAKMVGGFDKDNNLTALDVRLSGQSIVAALFPANLDKGTTNPKNKGMDPNTFQGLQRPGMEHAFGYSVPNLLIDHAMRNPHVPPGFWRGVNINQNAIFMECFMDQVAQAVGQDELEFRRKLMKGLPRNLAVLNAVAEKIGWGKPAPQGVYPWSRANDGVRQLRGGGGGNLRHRQQAQGAAHRRRHRLDLRGQSGADRPAGGRFGPCTVSPHCSTRSAPSRTARSSSPTSTTTTRCGSPRCRRSNWSSCRPAATPAGAALASPPSAWPRRL